MCSGILKVYLPGIFPIILDIGNICLATGFTRILKAESTQGRLNNFSLFKKETMVNPWLIHVNVWQKPLQYCKVISLQLIKINGKKKERPWAITPRHEVSSVQLLSRVRPWDTMDCSTPGFPVHHQLLELCHSLPLEKGTANPFSILALRTPWTVWKGMMCGDKESWLPWGPRALRLNVRLTVECWLWPQVTGILVRAATSGSSLGERLFLTTWMGCDWSSILQEVVSPMQSSQHFRQAGFSSTVPSCTEDTCLSCTWHMPWVVVEVSP